MFKWERVAELKSLKVSGNKTDVEKYEKWCRNDEGNAYKIKTEKIIGKDRMGK